MPARSTVEVGIEGHMAMFESVDVEFEAGTRRMDCIQSAQRRIQRARLNAPKIMTATSTLHRTPSSYAFLKRPFLRYSSSRVVEVIV